MTDLNLHDINEDSGQITIPKEVRDQFDTNTFHVFADTDSNCIVLKSVRVEVDNRDEDGW